MSFWLMPQLDTSDCALRFALPRHIMDSRSAAQGHANGQTCCKKRRTSERSKTARALRPLHWRVARPLNHFYTERLRQRRNDQDTRRTSEQGTRPVAPSDD